MPPDLRDWINKDRLVHFIMDAVDALDLRTAKINESGTGSAQYPPATMLALLIYCYATGPFSSRGIETLTFENVVVRSLCAETYPDHNFICKFSRENKALLASCFHQILELATLGNILKVGDLTVSGDGTKLFANASKHSAMSHDRLATLKEAKAVLEERAKIRFEKEQAEHEQKLAQRQAKEDKTGGKTRGKTPKPPEPGPRPKDQDNFTDPKSGIMKSGGGFEQCDNFQAAVEVETMLIIGGLVTDAVNDKEQLIPLIQAISPTVDAAIKRTSHGRNVAQLEEHSDPDPPYQPGATITEMRAHRLSTKVGRALYKLRKETVEPVFGIIKEVRGFRRFMLRGMVKGPS